MSVARATINVIVLLGGQVSFCKFDMWTHDSSVKRA